MFDDKNWYVQHEDGYLLAKLDEDEITPWLGENDYGVVTLHTDEDKYVLVVGKMEEL
jgi:hypothetical protein